MNQLKVLKKALRQLAQQGAAHGGGEGGPPASSSPSGDAGEPSGGDVGGAPRGLRALLAQHGVRGVQDLHKLRGLPGAEGLEGLAALEGLDGSGGMKALKALKAGLRGGVGARGANNKDRDGAGDGARRAAKAGKGLGGLRGLAGPGVLAAAAAVGHAGLAEAGPRAMAAPMPPPAGVVEETVTYKQTTKGPLQLHVFLPAAPPPPGGRACFVFFHGGSWRRGSSNQFRAFSAVLAQHGIVGMSVDYRLLEGDERLIPFEAMQDARSAMRFVRRNASRFGCDAGRIGAGGGSAGAHLAMMTALKAPVDDPGDDVSIDPRPAALICLNGPTNFDGYASPVPVDERRRYSPYYLVDGRFPPTLLMHGTQDKVIPFAQVVAFRDKAVKLGVNVRLVPFEGRGHGFFNKGKGQPGDWDRSANEMLAFLRGIGWL